MVREENEPFTGRKGNYTMKTMIFLCIAIFIFILTGFYGWATGLWLDLPKLPFSNTTYMISSFGLIPICWGIVA